MAGWLDVFGFEWPTIIVDREDDLSKIDMFMRCTTNLIIVKNIFFCVH